MSEKTDLRRSLSLRLKQVRESLSYTQEKMAAFLGVSRNSYAKKEIGETYPGYQVLHKLGSNFDVSMDWFLLGRRQMFSKEKEVTREKIKEKEVLNPEHRELLEHMEKIPLLHYEVMAFFHKFKIQNKELIETTKTEGEEKV